MAYTNIGLIEHCKRILALGDRSVYVLGGLGNSMTSSFIESKCSQGYGVGEYNSTRRAGYQKLIANNNYGFDCVSLWKTYIMDWNNGKYTYKSVYDLNEQMILNKSTIKGKISTLPEIPGIGLVMNGHFGIYAGKGLVYEITPSQKFAKQTHGMGGCCTTKLSDRPWTNWCQIPGITYIYNKYAPIGCLDSCSSPSPKTIKFAGWAFDKDNSSQSIKVKVYINGAPSTITADGVRDDVNRVYGISGKHGFAGTLTTTKTGTVTIVFKAVDVNDGSEVEFAKKQITLKTESILELAVGDKYNLTKSIKVYTNSSNAKNKISSTATYNAGTYYIYSIYNGMVNITRTKGVPGGWINPSDL